MSLKKLASESKESSGCGECYRKVCVCTRRQDVIWESESVSSSGGRSHSRSSLRKKNGALEEEDENGGWQKLTSERKKAAAKQRKESRKRNDALEQEKFQNERMKLERIE